MDAVVADTTGTVRSWGDETRMVIPRSAIKSVQALPLFTTGAADAFDVTHDEIALACSSHSGEPQHLAAVQAWLTRIGLGVDSLRCGAKRPLGEGADRAMAAAGQSPTQLHNCCSGKHAGMLTVARQLEVDPADYCDREHPVQKHVTAAIEQATGISLDNAQPGIDGCGIPVYSIPLNRFAVAKAGIANSPLQTILPSRAFLISGTERTEVLLADSATEPIITKTGAEGVFAATLPKRQLGIVLKVRDGATRAADFAIGAILRELGAIDGAVPDGQIKNAEGRHVGDVIVRL